MMDGFFLTSILLINGKGIITRAFVISAVTLAVLLSGLGMANAQTTNSGAAGYLFTEHTLDKALEERAAEFKVDGVSVTTLDENGQTYTAYSGEGVDSNGLFQAASMSKPVAAVGVLLLAHQKGIELDADIRPYITSLDWTKIKGGDDPISLKQLLSHTAGATVSGFPGYRRSKKIPTSREVVMGGRGVNTPGVKLTGRKGRFSYSGGGYQILQLFVEDITGQPFDAAMKSLILGPLDMHKSSFAQSINPDVIKPLTIVAADDGFNPLLGVFRPLKNDWKNYPEQAAAGLWTTSDDYMKFANMLLRIHRGEDALGVPNSVLALMMTEVDNGYGLGLILAHDENGDLIHFGHTGGNAGYRCIFRLYPQEERGIVALANNPKGIPVMKELIASISE